jgi:hypothetical protein
MYSGVSVDRAGGSESGVDCLVVVTSTESPGDFVDAMAFSAVVGEVLGGIDIVVGTGVCSRAAGGAWGSIRCAGNGLVITGVVLLELGSLICISRSLLDPRRLPELFRGV